MFKYLILMPLIASFMVGCTNSQIVDKAREPARTTLAKHNPWSSHILNCVKPLGHHIYKVDKACPVGGEKFEALQLSTHSTFGRHLDWEPVSYMRFPVPIPVCPTNGFVMAKSKYSKIDLQRTKKIIESQAYRDLYQERHATYYLYAQSLELMGEKPDDLWWLYLNATWEADLCGAESRYKTYVHQVIHTAKNRLKELDTSSDEYWVLNIIIPNMYRRTGDFQTAMKWVNQFGTPSLKNNEANAYFKLARDILKKEIIRKNTKRVPIKNK